MVLDHLSKLFGVLHDHFTGKRAPPGTDRGKHLIGNPGAEYLFGGDGAPQLVKNRLLTSDHESTPQQLVVRPIVHLRTGDVTNPILIKHQQRGDPVFFHLFVCLTNPIFTELVVINADFAILSHESKSHDSNLFFLNVTDSERRNRYGKTHLAHREKSFSRMGPLKQNTAPR